jgi:hypothetical protein
MHEKAKLVIRELLRLSYAKGFGCLFNLAEIAADYGVTELLYREETEEGILFEYGPYGHELLDVQDHGDGSIHAGVNLEMKETAEHWSNFTHHRMDPKVSDRDGVIEEEHPTLVDDSLHDSVPFDSGYYWISRFGFCKGRSIVYVHADDMDAGGLRIQTMSGEILQPNDRRIEGAQFEGPLTSRFFL